jgi:DNA repair protein RadA/Sms
VLFPGIEGSRVVMVEIQALITPTNMSIPRRAVIGWDINRLSMVLAILQNYCGIVLYDKEIYLNVTGGYKINEPGADLAVAIAIYSNLAKLVLPSKPIVFGEIGLSGEVREVSNLEKRLKEARKLGFSDAITNYKGAKNHELKNFTIKNLSNIKNLKSVF